MRRIMFALVLVIFLKLAVFGLSIDGKINIATDYLTEVTKERIIELPAKLQQYLQSATYSDADLNLDYELSLLVKEISSGSIMTFSVELQLIEKNYKVQHRDKKIRIVYDPFEMLMFNEFQFHKLTSILDFYFYMTLGDIMDNYKELGGNEMYEKALRIAKEGTIEQSNRGWDRREEKIMFLRSEDLKDFRLTKVIIRSALAALENDDTEIAFKNIFTGLNKLKTVVEKFPENDVITSYINSIYSDIAESFSEYDENEDVYKLLSEVDTSHVEYYKQFLENEE